MGAASTVVQNPTGVENAKDFISSPNLSKVSTPKSQKVKKVDGFKSDKQSNINKFIDSAFGEYSKDRSLFESLLQDAASRGLFKEFLKNECAEENLEFFEAVEKIKSQTIRSNEIEVDALETMTKDLVDTFLSSGSDTDVSANISSFLCDDIQNQLLSKNRTEDEAVKLLQDLEQAQNEIVFIMAMSVIPKFLQSNAYKNYLEQLKTQDPNAPANNNNQEGGAGGVTSISPRGSIVPLPQKSLRMIDSVDRDFVLGPKGSWLSGLFAASEALPICISLATARRDRPGFPLIHVNQVFESTTGYTRDTIIGTNCRFLQTRKVATITPATIVNENDTTTAAVVSETSPTSSSPPVEQNDENLTGLEISKSIATMTKSEPTSIARLSKALGTAQPVKVCITNFKKDGTPFVNLLAMKPIHDETGAYRYVVGVQFDVSRETNSTTMLHLAEVLLNTIPNLIYSNQDE